MEPDEAMIEAGAHEMTGSIVSTCCVRTGRKLTAHTHPECDCRAGAPAIFRAMIKHALIQA
jgi:hypothetical protein